MQKRRAKGKTVKQQMQKKLTKAERTELLLQHVVKVVNNNSASLQAFQHGMNNINILTRRHVILLSIIQERLGITDDDIRAESEKKARQVANDNDSFENEGSYTDVWLDSKFTICEVLLSDGKEELIVRNTYPVWGY